MDEALALRDNLAAATGYDKTQQGGTSQSAKAGDVYKRQVILPFTIAHLLRRVAFRQPVPLAQIGRVVVHVQGQEVIVAERQGKHIVSLHLSLIHIYGRSTGRNTAPC